MSKIVVVGINYVGIVVIKIMFSNYGEVNEIVIFD